MEVKLFGLQAVQQALRDAPRHIVVRSFARSLDAAGGVIAAEVELHAEQLNETDTDTPLYEHVTVQTEVDTSARGGITSVGFDSTQDARTGIPQDLKAFLVEYGHRMVTHAPGKKEVGTVPPRPFVRLAFEASADRAIAVFAETLAQEIDKP